MPQPEPIDPADAIRSSIDRLQFRPPLPVDDESTIDLCMVASKNAFEVARRFAILGSPDLHAAYLAGCEITYDTEHLPGGRLRVTARTTHPVGVVRNPDGSVAQVYERKG